MPYLPAESMAARNAGRGPRVRLDDDDSSMRVAAETFLHYLSSSRQRRKYASPALDLRRITCRVGCRQEFRREWIWTSMDLAAEWAERSEVGSFRLPRCYGACRNHSGGVRGSWLCRATDDRCGASEWQERLCKELLVVRIGETGVGRDESDAEKKAKRG